jgi:hypothetical protein
MDRSPRGGPLYLAWRILDDPSSQCFDATRARDYFRTSWVPSPVPRQRDILSHPMSEELAYKLAHRAEAVFAGIAFENAFSGCVNRLH